MLPYVIFTFQFGPTLHHITLHYKTLHYTTLQNTTLHHTTLHYTTLVLAFHDLVWPTLQSALFPANFPQAVEEILDTRD